MHLFQSVAQRWKQYLNLQLVCHVLKLVAAALEGTVSAHARVIKVQVAPVIKSIRATGGSSLLHCKNSLRHDSACTRGESFLSLHSYVMMSSSARHVASCLADPFSAGKSPARPLR